MQAEVVDSGRQLPSIPKDADSVRNSAKAEVTSAYITRS